MDAPQTPESNKIPAPSEGVVSLVGLKLIRSQRTLRALHPALVNDYDMALAGYLLVWKDGKRYLLIDGQHRAESARRAGETDHLALIYEGITEQQAAHLFYKHNTDRVGMNAQMKFGSAVDAGYPEQVEIEAIVSKIGGTVNRSNNRNGINAVGMLERIYKHRGAEGLRRVLAIIKEAWPEYRFSVPASSSAMMAGLAYFDTLHLDETGTGETADRDVLLKRMKHNGPEDIQRRGDGIFGVRKATREAAYYYALVDTYNYRARNGVRIVEGKPSWKSVTISYCEIEGCEHRASSRGLCRTHYSTWQKEMYAKNQGLPQEEVKGATRISQRGRKKATGATRSSTRKKAA